MARSNLTKIERGFYKTRNDTFGGYIYLSDFDTEYCRSKNIAARIASDWKFDEQCKRNALGRERIKKLNMSEEK